VESNKIGSKGALRRAFVAFGIFQQILSGRERMSQIAGNNSGKSTLVP
jgi:hypothetical protein